MNKSYQNREWLYKKYWGEMLSLSQIAKLCKVDLVTIYNWLKKFNIPRRSIGEANHLIQANHCNLSQKIIEFLNGELLGDGSLCSKSKYSARFVYSSAKEEYIKYLAKKLKLSGIKQSGKIRKKYHELYNCYTYQYKSRSYVELLPIYKKWYPEGKKIVPDIELTSLTCKQWYIGDGCLLEQRYVFFATDGFKLFDVNCLVKKLIKLGFKAIRQKSSNRIRLSVYSTKNFLDYIGKCPVKCYQYKWAY